jgi:hypothetical protein
MDGGLKKKSRHYWDHQELCLIRLDKLFERNLDPEIITQWEIDFIEFWANNWEVDFPASVIKKIRKLYRKYIIGKKYK